MGFIGTTKVVPFQNRGFDKSFSAACKVVPFQNRGFDRSFSEACKVVPFQNRGFSTRVFPQPVKSCPFKTEASTRVFPQPVKSCPFKTEASTRVFPQPVKSCPDACGGSDRSFSEAREAPGSLRNHLIAKISISDIGIPAGFAMSYHDGKDFSAMNSVLKLRFARFALLWLSWPAECCLPDWKEWGRRAPPMPRRSPPLCPPTPGGDRPPLQPARIARWRVEDACRRSGHGEAVNLDESEWQPIAKGKAPKDAVWFRQTLSGSGHAERLRPDRRAHLVSVPRRRQRADAGDSLLQWPPRGHGRRPGAGGAFDNAKPGDKVTVAVKLLHTVDDKTFEGATLKIDFPESRPNPEDLREEFLSAALLVPALAPGDAAQDGHA